MAGKTWKMPPPAPKLVPVAPKVDFESKGAGSDVLRTMGASALVANILQLPKVAMDAAGREMSIILHEIIVEGQDGLVPVDTGDLRDSGDSDVYVPGSGATVTTLAAWYGGPVTAEEAAHGKKDEPRLYALEQHEDMELNHPHGGGPKFLEIPFTNKLPTIAPRLAAAIGEALGMNGAFVNLGINEGPITVVDPDYGVK